MPSIADLGPLCEALREHVAFVDRRGPSVDPMANLLNTTIRLAWERGEIHLGTQLMVAAATRGQRVSRHVTEAILQAAARSDVRIEREDGDS